MSPLTAVHHVAKVIIFFVGTLITRVARGNLVTFQDCPAAVNGNDRRHKALA
jgi:hypothetical protein